MLKKVLAIDDDENYLKSVKKILEMYGFSTLTVSNPRNVLEIIQAQDFNAIFLDVKMPGLNGIELFQIIQKNSPFTPVIIISGQSSIEIAVDFIKNGAYDFLEKPIDAERLLVTLKNAIKKKELVLEKEAIYSELLENNRIIGESRETNELLKQIEKVTSTNAKVLITGETGVGKELVAWSIHHNSDRRSANYIKVNCAAIPSELLESELFGHTKGSFTSAHEDKIGKFEAANGGTLFLDEIGDMDSRLQSKILRVLEDNEIEKVGSNSSTKVDVRIITATNKNIKTLVESGTFREDLYHRINVVRINVPSLRERKDDILPLVYHYMQHFCESYNKKVKSISRQGESILKNLHWPGNVRELKNVVEKLVIFTSSKEISGEQILHVIESSQTFDFDDEIKDLKAARSDFEKDYILKALEQHDWKIVETADSLGIDRTNLFKKIKDTALRSINTISFLKCSTDFQSINR